MLYCYETSCYLAELDIPVGAHIVSLSSQPFSPFMYVGFIHVRVTEQVTDHSAKNSSL